MSVARRHVIPTGLIAVPVFALAERWTGYFVQGNRLDGSVTAWDVRSYLLLAFVIAVTFSTLVMFPAALVAERWTEKRPWPAALLPVASLILPVLAFVLGADLQSAFLALVGFGCLLVCSLSFCLYWIVLLGFRACLMHTEGRADK